VHGACSNCKDYSVEEEVIAWRTRENKRQEREAGAPTARDHLLDLTARTERPCPECGATALTVGTVFLVSDDGNRRRAGGWAYCTGCEAAPHPTMPGPEQILIDRIRALHYDDHGLCHECTESHGVLYPCPTIRAIEEAPVG
jgi:hypothetical protein